MLHFIACSMCICHMSIKVLTYLLTHSSFLMTFFKSPYLSQYSTKFPESKTLTTGGPEPQSCTSTTILVRPLAFGKLSGCFAALHQLRQYVTDDCFHSLVLLLVHSRLDYGNFVLVRLPAYLQRRLQSVLNAAARLVFRQGHHNHISDALATLHWLRLPQRVDFKVAVMVFRVLHGFAPPYLYDRLFHRSA